VWILNALQNVQCFGFVICKKTKKEQKTKTKNKQTNKHAKQKTNLHKYLPFVFSQK